LDKKGSIVVSSFTNKHLEKNCANFFKKIYQDYRHIAKVKINDTKYLVTINNLINNQQIAVVIPYYIMIKKYKNIITSSISFVFVFIIFSLPFVLFFIKKVSLNTKLLMEQNKLVAERKFDEVTPIDSSIEEFRNLSISLSNMAKDIKNYQQALEDLFDSLIKMTANAIDMKSKYTGNHCKRVPEIALMLVKKVSECNYGSLKDFKITSNEQLKEIEVASWLHDCGKLTTPEFIVDKSTKLETIYNRIHEIRTRFEVLWRDLEIEGLKRKLAGEDENIVNAQIEKEKEALKKDFEFIAKCNIGDNFVNDEDRERLNNIAKKTWKRNFDKNLGLSQDETSRLPSEGEKLPVVEQLIDDKPEHLIKRENFDLQKYTSKGFTMKIPERLYNLGEIYNLSIPKGTLTEEERFKINEHIIASIQMLENLPFPEELKNVPEYAGAHHDQINGKGYPRGLTKEKMSVPARILALSDIFEALTATDRPYKKAKKISETLKIMRFMAIDGHIDSEIFNIFVKEKVYLEYAKKYLKSELIDVENHDEYLI
jgi:HD-GYP domain-containing protein (c-di-GMP phosphodiesterase class II)